MSDPVESKQTHEEWCHDRIQALELEVACFQDEARARERNEVGHRRHHDVFCLVLKEVVRFTASQRIANQLAWTEMATEHVKVARFYADLAYPLPKTERSGTNPYEVDR